MRYTRPRWVSHVASALVLALICAILYAGAVLLPQLSEANRTDQEPSTAGANEPRQPETDKNAQPIPAPDPKPEPQPKRESNQPESSPEPESTPEPGPEPKPDDTIEEPKPQPEPHDTVERPKPESEPDDTVEQPQPEPKPDDTVDVPKEPEPTTPTPDSRLAIRLLTEIDWKRPGLKMFDYSPDGEEWTHAERTSRFAGNVWLRTRSSIDFEAAGVFLRLKGTMRVSLTEDQLSVELTDDELFLDNRGASRDVGLLTSGFDLSLFSGAMYVDKARSNTEIKLFEGDVAISNEKFSGPVGGTLSSRGKQSLSPLRLPMNREAFLMDLKPRSVYREDFNVAEPLGRLREGQISDGVLKGPTVFWGYPEPFQHEFGMVIRLRVRFSNAESATLTQFATPREDNFSFELAAVKSGEWYVLEVPLDKFLERTTHKDHPNEVDWFRNVSITTEGENSQVELDWVELIRAVK